MKSAPVYKLIVVVLLLISLSAHAQIIEFESATGGFLPPRMTTVERDAIPNASEGMIIFNTTTGRINYYESVEGWLELYPKSRISLVDYLNYLPNGVESVLAAGETVENLLADGVNVQLIFDGGASVQALSDAGISNQQLYDIGANPLDIYNVGATVQELIDMGETIASLVNANLPLQALLDYGETPAALIGYGIDTASFIGTSYGGGIIFYIENNGTGLVAAPSDQGSNIQWGCYDEIPGTQGTAIGTGNQNTIDIVTSCTMTNVAVEICANLDLNGYTDWFLPSKDELYEMYLIMGGTGNSNGLVGEYWSSTEYADVFGYENAWAINLNNGAQYFYSKYSYLNIRAVRAF